MANLPLRTLGQLGAIPDANPFDLPINAFSSCSNVVFDEGTIQRAPVFKTLYPAILSALKIEEALGSYDDQTGTYQSATGAPVDAVRFVGTFADPVAGQTLFVTDNSGEVRGYPNGNLQFLHPGGTLVDNNNVWSHAQVAGLSFLARKGMRPYARNVSTDAIYQYMGADWPADHEAGIIRGYNDFVIALNMKKGTEKFPTMVKWSNPVPYDSTPAEVFWDHTNPAYVAGENIIGEMTSEIRDGLVLGSQFVLYSKEQVWLMEYTGSSFVFNFRRLFPSGGVVNTNCVAEVDGKHFVFGEDDFYMHDGISKKSLADGRIRRHVYKTLDRAKLNSCFVLHDPVSNLIFFCYASKETTVGYVNTQFANKAAIYNYRADTWAFMDLPNVVGAGSINLDLSENLELLNGPGIDDLYDTTTVSPGATSPLLTVMLGATSTAQGLGASRVYAVDLPEAGVVQLDPEPETIKTAWVERTGIDLDDPGLGLKLRTYKVINGIVPQIESSIPVRWRTGSADKPNDAPVWYSDREFDPHNDYKIDLRVAGRYLAYRVDVEGSEQFKFSAFDADVAPLSHR